MLSDTLPSEVNFVSAIPTQGSCTNPDGTVTCNLGIMTNGATVLVFLAVTPTEPGLLTNSAEVKGSATDPNSANNTATTETTVLTN